jgi:hypothetical protein
MQDGTDSCGIAGLSESTLKMEQCAWQKDKSWNTKNTFIQETSGVNFIKLFFSIIVNNFFVD